MPFANLSSDPEQDYFVEGMMDEIVMSLTRIRTLRVISSESSRALKDLDWDNQQAAARLGVRFLLQGSVRWAGAQVRIAVKLIDAVQGSQIWADRFDDTLANVFELQDRIALKVCSVIEPSIHEAEVRRVARQPLENLGCYDLYLRAAPLRASCNKEEVIHALHLLDRALALDPDFAPALAQAAGCHSQLFCNGWDEIGPWHKEQGLKLAERAMRTGSEDASVLAQAANALADLDADLARAAALADRATSLNPGCARAWFISGLIALMAGEGHRGSEHLRTAVELDPISPLNEIARAHIGIGEILKGEFSLALELMRATTHRTPRLHVILGALLGYLGHPAEAKEEFEQFRALSPLPLEEYAANLSNVPRVRELFGEGIRRGLDLG